MAGASSCQAVRNGGDLAAVEPLLRKAADHEIRTIIPLTDLVAEVRHLASLSPDGHDTLKPHPG
jgi:hypothetical protein